jgi:ribulose-5-phosphate 4-epimerase/fuculose-1-phosphate aldolase
MESTEVLITDQKVTDLPEEQDVVENEEPSNQEVETANDEMEQETIEELVEVPEVIGEEYAETISHPEIPVEGESDVTTNVETEAEIARLNAEVERLRRSMAGAAEVIEELENPPMPPAVMDNLVIGAHIIGDMARLARQLDREQLIRASMGTIAMLHPDQLEIIVSTKHMALLPRMDERDICAAKLGVDPPRGAPADWRVLEVVLASVSLITGGPAAVIHSHGPFTTAASCEKDLVLVQPIDQIGKKHIGKIIIVDPDDDNPEEFLRQVAEALQQGGMRCVVIRGMGAYAVGADLDQAWANAAMLEHSMKIVLLARQANLKV